MVSYSYPEFLQAVRQVRRTAPTGCYVCDIFETSQGARAFCERISGGTVDAHHVIPKQMLKREWPRGISLPVPGPPQRYVPGQEIERSVPFEVAHRSLDDLLMDPRNGILVRRYHHDAIEQRALTIPLESLPESVIDFAHELGLGWYLQKMDDRRTG